MINEHHIQGIFIPVITPFTRDNQLDLDSYRSYITHLASYDIQGLVINGTTGECPTTSWDEVKQMIQITQDIVNRMNLTIPIVVGTGTNDTYSTVRRTELAAGLGADAALVVTPYYNRPTQEGILEHFRMVSQTGLPVIAYEIPARTGSRIHIDTMRRIMDLDGVIGLKDSSGSLDLLSALVQSDSKPVLCGEDVLFHDMLCQGAAGGMMASANIQTQLFVDIYQHYAAGNIQESREDFNLLKPLIQHLFEEPAPAALKWLLSRQEIIATDQLRLPLMPLSAKVRERLLETWPLNEKHILLSH
ncbi:4-hydroxy-tetrahydrodipicolinate synthase [Paenibacillus sp. JX-17]|uniref:4-hydroxy-tetrahydrodipicolinate synthase n=1 Tax=Paenibacillus lacisoli TaxID=3064525 RepID=A0ABT9CH20_9BACL|nr:4-hydroxy-tetrahydrodipicolinate synthase [Paenibacillus sp. JX-17]MDO7907944.1 4-hydroxy-tetrahydrodipicolinate synthase [Paenibacillus sp. JX-17]